jgi:hypothetical protein
MHISIGASFSTDAAAQLDDDHKRPVLLDKTQHVVG